MRLKWWQKLLLNGIIASGVGFFGSLTALFSAGITDWRYALIGAGITAGFTFFTTCQHYVQEKDPGTGYYRKEKVGTSIAKKNLEEERNKDVEVKNANNFNISSPALAFI